MAGDRDLVSGVIQLANLLNRRLAPVFEKAGVTPQQWAVLSAVARADGPVTLVGLARRLAVTKQNMTGMIARLEQAGVIVRHGDPADLRSSLVTVTRRGRNLVERLGPVYEEWLRTAGGTDIPEREIQALTKSIERLIEALER
ncbi:MAG TPA: MarR family transcriptional regulator [Thermoanaerobaculia bacterium]